MLEGNWTRYVLDHVLTSTVNIRTPVWEKFFMSSYTFEILDTDNLSIYNTSRSEFKQYQNFWQDLDRLPVVILHKIWIRSSIQFMSSLPINMSCTSLAYILPLKFNIWKDKLFSMLWMGSSNEKGSKALLNVKKSWGFDLCHKLCKILISSKADGSRWTKSIDIRTKSIRTCNSFSLESMTFHKLRFCLNSHDSLPENWPPLTMFPLSLSVRFAMDSSYFLHLNRCLSESMILARVE